MEILFWVKDSVLLATMTKYASYPIANITFHWQATLELLQKMEAFCFNYQHAVSVHFSSTASEAKLLSRVDNSLIICAGQFIPTTETEKWIKRPASWNRDSWGERTKSFCWAASKWPNWSKLVDQFLQRELNKLKRLRSDKICRLFSRWSW